MTLSNITKEIWEKGEEGTKMLEEYVKRIILRTIDIKTQIGTKKDDLNGVVVSNADC
jgi:hypothetical protein